MVQASRLGFRKERLLSGYIDQGGGFSRRKAFIPPLENWCTLIYGVSEFLEAEIDWESHSVLKEQTRTPRYLVYTCGIAETLRKLYCDPELSS